VQGGGEMSLNKRFKAIGKVEGDEVDVRIDERLDS
jgi:hypothetical protein